MIPHQERSCRNDQAGNAVAALHGALFEKCFLHRIQFAIPHKSFGCDYVGAFRLRDQHETRTNGLAVYENGARSTLAFGAVFLRTGNVQLLAKNFEKRVGGRRLHSDSAAVESEADLTLDPHFPRLLHFSNVVAHYYIQLFQFGTSKWRSCGT